MSFLRFLRGGEESSRSTDQAESQPPLGDYERDLFRQILEYGATADASMIEQLMPLYVEALEKIPAEHRREMLMQVIPLLEQKRVHITAMFPFIFRDTDLAVIGTATLHAAGAWEGSDRDPLLGVRELFAYAKSFGENGDEQRAAVMFSALAALGDRRVIRTLGPCWKLLSPAGRDVFARDLHGRSYAGTVDLLLSWLEDCEGDEFGAVAGVLGRMPTLEVPGKVLDVRRGMPVWCYDESDVVRIVQEWTYPDYGKLIRRRMLQIAADEHQPRVMHEVLKAWSIDSNQRLYRGVAMRSSAAIADAQAVTPALHSAPPRTLVPLSDEVFKGHHGRLLVSWAIFNPYGPTWSCLGTIPTADPEFELLFYRMLNPFQQDSGSLGVLRRGDASSGAKLGRFLQSLFIQNEIERDAGGVTHLITDSLPTVIVMHEEDRDLRRQLLEGILNSPAVLRCDVRQAIADREQSPEDPWERARVQLTRGAQEFKRIKEGGSPRGVVPPAQEEVEKWLWLVAMPENHGIELGCFPGAWHGSIDVAAPHLAAHAYTFWQLEDFLARYGFPLYREIGPEDTPESTASAEAAETRSNDEEIRSYAAIQRDIEERSQRLPPLTANPAEFAYLIAASALLRQLVPVEEGLNGQSRSALRRTLRRPWALGYLMGVAGAMVRACELPEGSNERESVAMEIPRIALDRIALHDLSALYAAASQEDGFREGLDCGMGDIFSMSAATKEPDGLLNWLTRELSLPA